MSSYTHPLDIAIFVVFLAVTLIIGLLYGQNVKDIKEYSVGGRDFSITALTASIVVSWIGGSDLFWMLEETYKNGLYFAIVIPGAAICLLLVGQMATRMGRFLKNISVAEALGDLYGERVRVIAAISGILSVLGVVAIEFQVMGKIITLIFGIEGPWITFLSAFIVILYSISGGIRSVTFTDVFQFFTFATVIPILALAVWSNLKSPNQVMQMLYTHPNFNLSEVIGWHPRFISALVMFVWFAVPGMDPVVFQRVSMSRNVAQVKRSFSYAGIISLLVNLFIVWLVILMLAENRHLEPDKLFNHIVQSYATIGFKGLIGVGVMALVMSTADSYLNASAVLFANDIIKAPNIADRHRTRVAQVFCGFAGFVALFLALRAENILELLMISNSFYMPIVTVPLLLAIFGFHSSPRAALIGIGLGFSTVLGWYFFADITDSILPGMIANLVGITGSHYLLGEPGGWQKVTSE